MNPTNLVSCGTGWKRAFASSVEAATGAFDSGGVPSIARSVGVKVYPSDSTLAILDLRGGAATGAAVPMSLMLKPFGTTTANQVFAIRLWGITVADDYVGSTYTQSFETTRLCELACTLGSKAGAANTLVGTSDLFCDTIAITEGLTDVVKIFTPEDNVKEAWAWIDHLAFDQIGIEFSETDAVTMNTLYRFVM